jgi:hypothetical protein
MDKLWEGEKCNFQKGRGKIHFFGTPTSIAQYFCKQGLLLFHAVILKYPTTV